MNPQIKGYVVILFLYSGPNHSNIVFYRQNAVLCNEYFGGCRDIATIILYFWLRFGFGFGLRFGFGFRFGFGLGFGLR